MELTALEKTLISFADDPTLSWGSEPSGRNFREGTQARVPVQQADRNTARLRSGTYTEAQLESFNQQCKSAESGGGTACFDPILPEPDSLPFSQTCQDCQQRFDSCSQDAQRCYECELRVLCPSLPHRNISARWSYDDWRLEVFGAAGFGSRNQLTYWWSNRNSGGKVFHQALVVQRDINNRILRMELRTIASHAVRRYNIIWNYQADTTEFTTSQTRSVNDDRCGPTADLDELDPLALDFIIAMLPSWMVYTHRPRNPANGCFAG